MGRFSGPLWDELIAAAFDVRTRAYAPYSHHPVGCALVDEQGQVHTGCNVENANYTDTVCAERTAIVKMVSFGGRQVVRLALVTPQPEPVFPCGSCRQTLAEFGDPLILALSDDGERSAQMPLRDLLPHRFGPEHLNKNKGRSE